MFDSQIAGGKRYDLATMAAAAPTPPTTRATRVDTAQMINFGMDLTPLIEDPSLDPGGFVQAHISRFAEEVRARFAKLL